MELGFSQPGAWLLLPLCILLPGWMIWRGIPLPHWRPALAVRNPMLPAVLRAREHAVTHDRDRPLSPWLLTPAMALMCLALSGPELIGPVIPPRPAPVDVVFIVDTSLSMATRDYHLDDRPISRLDLAKRLISHFGAAHDGRLGLVIAGTPPAVWMPYSADRGLFEHLLGRLQASMAGRNTALGDALALTAERYGEGRHPLALLISDGSTPLGRVAPGTGAQAISAAGMTLHVLALGTQPGTDGAPAPAGAAPHESADLALLDTIARTTGGRMLRAADSEALIEALAPLLDAHRARLAPIPVPRARTPLYPWPLLAGMLFLAALPLVHARGTRSGRATDGTRTAPPGADGHSARTAHSGRGGRTS
ncbi:MAG: vWA domain-containing protein [Gammaproteobacteria bacterium]